MRALLNAMGVMLWGAIAITLAVTVVLIGYRAALDHKNVAANDQRPAIAPPADLLPAAPPKAEGRSQATPPPLPDRKVATAYVTTRNKFHRAAVDSQFAAVERYGQQLFEDGEATADDMALIGHFRYLQSDCATALTWSERSIASARARRDKPPQSAYLVKSQCAPRVESTTRIAAMPGNVIPFVPAPKDPRKISLVIAQQMSAAQKAVQAQQWQEAVKNLNAAEQISGTNDFDQKTIHDLLGYVDIKLGELRAAQGEYEKAFATGAATAEEAAGMTKALFAIAASTNQYQKTIDYGKKMLDAGTATAENLLLISQSYFQMRDCRDAVGWANKGIASARAAGETPKENFFLFKLQCASDAQDNAAMAPVLMDLIKVNNRENYWNTLLRIERQDERDDHNTLMIYRIMYNTQSMREDSDFIEMAQLLGDAGLPGEGASVIGQATSTGIVKDEHKERLRRLLNSLQSRADADEESLAKMETAATTSSTGEPSIKLGELYYGVGDYEKSVDAIAYGLHKSQIRQLDEAYVYLGLAQDRLGNFNAAKQAFAGLKLVPNVSARMLRLWDLYASSISAPLTAAR